MARVQQNRILIVDDFGPWRDQLRSLLQTRWECSIISEASDGQEAIAKAAEMQPQIILLDIGLPDINGIEVAKIIRQRCPKSKIIFVSANTNGDIIEAAMTVGDSYVGKAEVGHQLLDVMALHCSFVR